MKNFTKYILLGILVATAITATAQPGAPYYGVNKIPLCWTTGGGIDSSIYVSQVDVAGRTTPNRLYYYNASNTAVSVVGGNLRFGHCTTSETDSLTTRLDTLISQLNVLIQDNDSLILLNLLNLLNSDTFLINQQIQIGQQDTVIIYLDSVLNYQAVTEPGCLVVVDSAGCPFTGLAAYIGNFPPVPSEIRLNGAVLFYTVVPPTCPILAEALNLWDPNDGTWACCSDSLVVNSLNTTTYQTIAARPSSGSTIYTSEFADTIGNGIRVQRIPVEIIKVIGPDGGIDTVRVYSSDGQTEYTGTGTVSAGPCEPQELNVMLQVKLDSLIQATTEPQVCTCSYTLDLVQHNFTVQQNAQLPVWNYQRSVTRNCGAGAEEVFRQAGSATATSKASTFYTYATTPLVDGSGVIDSVRIFFRNPDTSSWIYLSPGAVAANYPALLVAGLDTAKLRFSVAGVADMNAAITTVMSYGLLRVATTHSPPLPAPTFDFSSEVNASGHVVLRFYVYHLPTGFYAGVNNTAASRSMHLHPTAGGSQVQTNGAGIIGINQVVAGTYLVPCDTTIQTVYSGSPVSSGDMNWFTLTVQDPALPSLAGSLGTATCVQACPETGACVEICNTEENPVPVTIVGNDVPCLTGNSFTAISTASSPVSLPANTYHSIVIRVRTGTAALTYVNSGTPVTETYLATETISFAAKECELISTGFSLDLSSGTATISVGQ